MPERFLRVYMDVNNKCNLRCRMCYFHLDLTKEQNVVMGRPLFDKIAAQIFPKAASLNLSCSAEPLLVPGFPAYVKTAKSFGVPYVLIVTNAMLLTEKISSELMESGLDQIDVSIDAATKATYESIRKGGDFERVIGNVRKLQALKKRAGRDNPSLFLDYTLMKSTIRELPDFLRIAADLGADSVRANFMIPFKRLDIMDESLSKCPAETNEILDKARAAALELGLNAAIPQNIENAEQSGNTVVNKPSCRVPFESLYVISDGRVLPCTWFSMKEWQAGDMKSGSFDDIWSGPVYTELRKRFEEGSYTPYCLNCPVYGNEARGGYVFTERSRDDVLNICPQGV